MRRDDKESILRRTTATWGIRSQLGVLIEELCELGAAANRVLRERDGAHEGFVEEFADVEIMMAQVRLHYGPEFEREVEAMIARKLERLRSRLDEEGAK